MMAKEITVENFETEVLNQRNQFLSISGQHGVDHACVRDRL